MNFIELNTEYQNDTNITKENLEEKLYSSAVLHGKYHKYLYLWRSKLYKLEKEKGIKYRDLYYYYKNDYKHTLDAKELKWHIETDKDYIDLNRRYKIIKSEVEQIGDWCKHCNNLSFFTGNIVKFITHMNGEN